MSRPPSEGDATGPELVRAALEAARSARRPAARRRDGNGGVARRGGYSGSGSDARDPQLFGAHIKRLLHDRGWEQAGAPARIFGAWDQLVGPEVADKCQPVSLREGELVVAAISTAWATQLRMPTKTILANLRRGLGNSGADVVKRIKVHGPVAPSWKRGGRSVPGRGPRDTYG